MSSKPSTSKKITTFKDFKSEVNKGALGDLDDVDFDDENQDEKNQPISLGKEGIYFEVNRVTSCNLSLNTFLLSIDVDEFLNLNKDGPKRLEDDVSTDSSMDSKIRDIVRTNRKLGADELVEVNDRLYKWLVKRAEKVLRKRGRGYDVLTKLYTKKRMEDPGEGGILALYRLYIH